MPLPRPTPSPGSATTPRGYNHCGTVRDPIAQHLGWPPLQQHQTITLLATGLLPGISQTTTNATSMAKDIATMAKVIPNVPLKLLQKIIQSEFIDISELLQADFQFKYASLDSPFELVHKDETGLMWPRKKYRQIDCLSMWLSAWVFHEQVMVYTYPQRYSKLAYYLNFIMQQDKKFIWSTVQM